MSDLSRRGKSKARCEAPDHTLHENLSEVYSNALDRLPLTYNTNQPLVSAAQAHGTALTLMDGEGLRSVSVIRALSTHPSKNQRNLRPRGFRCTRSIFADYLHLRDKGLFGYELRSVS